MAYSDAREETKVAGHTPVLPDITTAREWLGEIIGIIAAADVED